MLRTMEYRQALLSVYWAERHMIRIPATKW